MVTKRVELPSDLDEAIRTAAARSGQPEHELIVEALQERFAARPANPLPLDHPLHDIVGIADDPGFRSEDIEEWLAQNWKPEADWESA